MFDKVDLVWWNCIKHHFAGLVAFNCALLSESESFYMKRALVFDESISEVDNILLISKKDLALF